LPENGDQTKDPQKNGDGKHPETQKAPKCPDSLIKNNLSLMEQQLLDEQLKETFSPMDTTKLV
jgi:hypothetical protein